MVTTFYFYPIFPFFSQKIITHNRVLMKRLDEIKSREHEKKSRSKNSLVGKLTKTTTIFGQLNGIKYSGDFTNMKSKMCFINLAT